MDLYVLRHGVAVDRGSPDYPSDYDRPLTPGGIRRMTRQVKGLNALGIALDAIVTSPLVRALETAEIVHAGLRSSGRLVRSDALAPGGSPSDLMGELSSGYPRDGSVMVVGHEPYLSSLVSVLVAEGPGSLIRLRKGGLCKLRVPSPRYGRCGWIEWFMTPKQMVRLG